ncbi:hypothetical protein CMV_006092 [Castanea mollissima]|uniref:PB1-like domain-containing protein n=1 Tax=Castanea mollissima TaxID=60419 RepID=A0A8J4RPB4_9ROSI|nr:hypothetical protein CMV_006092 [Castanea mollissima]
MAWSWSEIERGREGLHRKRDRDTEFEEEEEADGDGDGDGGEVGVVDKCDPERWSKVEIEAICRDFGYTHVSRLWYKRLRDNGVFELIKNDNDVVLMTELADYDDPLFVSDSENFSSSEPDHPFDGYYNGKGYYCSGSNFEDDDDWDNGDDHWDVGSADGRAGGSASGASGADGRVEEPQQDGAVTIDSNDNSGDNDVEGARSMNQRYVGEDSASSDSDAVMHMHDQMGDGEMNSDYTTKELLSLSESSSDGEFHGDGDDGSDSKGGATVNERVVKNVRRRKKFLVFKPVSNPEHMVFEKYMLFTSSKQFKDAITKYAVKGR